MNVTNSSLRVTVIGIGYLGLTHAVCMADLGHRVLAIDVDKEKIAKAAAGEAPFFEPGLEPLLRKNLDSGRLRFTMSFAEIGEFGDIHFLCVGTPEGEAGRADLSSVYAAAQALAPHLASPCLIVGKSTVPVGTARQVMNRMRAIAPAGDQANRRRLHPRGLELGDGPVVPRGLAEQFADAWDDLAAVHLDVGHELVVRQAWHAVLEVEPGGAKGAEVGGHLLRDGFG